MAPNDVALPQRAHLPLTLSTFRAAAVASFILLIPFNTHFWVLLDMHSPHLIGTEVQGTFLLPLDAGFALIVLLSLPLLRPRKVLAHQPIGQLGSVVFAVVVAIWLLVFPTVGGAVMLLRVVGTVAVITAIRSMNKTTLVMGVIWPLAIAATIQAITALGQTLIWHNGIEVDATRLADGSAWTSGHGAFTGPYTLAAFVILAAVTALSLGISPIPSNKAFKSIALSTPARLAMWTTVVTAFAASATTFGRAVLLSVGLVVATYAIGWLAKRHRILVVSALATAVPFTVIALVVRSGWLVRASQTAAGDVTLRDQLISTAFTMIKANPWIGVGPVQYGSYMTQMDLPELDPHIVHNIPLLVTAEFGIIVGIVFTVWLAAMVIRSARLNVYAAAIGLSMLPLFLFDNLHYVYGNGIAMFAIWVALLDYHRDIATKPDSERSIVHDTVQNG